jgi:Ca2+-binding EF-hand superfamily protein
MATNYSAEYIYRAAIASYVNPVYEARQVAEAQEVAATVGLDAEGRPLSPVERIEKYFSIIDSKNQRKVSADDLASAWASHVKNPTNNDLQLIAREIDRFMRIADLDNDGYVSLNEYMHYMLTLIKEKEEGRRFEIHGILAEKCAKDPSLVDKLVTWFREKDRNGQGEISVDDFNSILEKVKIKERKRIQINESVFSLNRVTYSQYVMLMLGRTPSKISLISYDISGSATKNLSRILFGRKIEGIWHTSILAFGYEWWYGGDCFQSRPFSTPFGPTPDRVEDLGETTRTLAELKEFVKAKMRRKYNYQTYDVISNNCNNFTNDLSQFLTHHGIKSSIVSLPGDLLSGGLARIMRPFLNKWLGGFEGNEENMRVSANKDVIEDIRKEKGEAHVDLQVGDIAMWKRTETEHIFCEILQIRKDGKIRIKVFKNMKFKVKLIINKSFIVKIPKEELQQHENSINYLIALSILENQRSHNDKALMQHITAELIDNLVAGEQRLGIQSHHLSMIAPGGISDDDGGDGEDDMPARNWCKKCWRKLCCKNSG